MTNTPFGKTGFCVSPLGFGAAPIGFLKTERERVGRLLNALLDGGLNLIDTAAAYEGSEEMIAEAVGHRRKDFILVSKCGGKLADVPGEAFSHEVVAGTVDRSLRRLKVDALDVMLLHSCDLKTLQAGEALGALLEAQRAGKVRFVGYSGDNEAAAHAAAMPEIAVIETSISICDQANIDAVLPVAFRNNVGVLAKRPIANAAWKDLAQQQGLYQSYAKVYTDRLAAMKLKVSDLGIAGPPQQAWPEAALRFTLSQPGVNTAIIGTTNPDNALENIVAVGRGVLPADAVRRIRRAFDEAQAAAGAKWTGQT